MEVGTQRRRFRLVTIGFGVVLLALICTVFIVAAIVLLNWKVLGCSREHHEFLFNRVLVGVVHGYDIFSVPELLTADVARAALHRVVLTIMPSYTSASLLISMAAQRAVRGTADLVSLDGIDALLHDLGSLVSSLPYSTTVSSVGAVVHEGVKRVSMEAGIHTYRLPEDLAIQFYLGFAMSHLMPPLVGVQGTPSMLEKWRGGTVIQDANCNATSGDNFTRREMCRSPWMRGEVAHTTTCGVTPILLTSFGPHAASVGGAPALGPPSDASMASDDIRLRDSTPTPQPVYDYASPASYTANVDAACYFDELCGSKRCWHAPVAQQLTEPLSVVKFGMSAPYNSLHAPGSDTNVFVWPVVRGGFSSQQPIAVPLFRPRDHPTQVAGGYGNASCDGVPCARPWDEGGGLMHPNEPLGQLEVSLPGELTQDVLRRVSRTLLCSSPIISADALELAYIDFGRGPRALWDEEGLGGARRRGGVASSPVPEFEDFGINRLADGPEYHPSARDLGGAAAPPPSPVGSPPPRSPSVNSFTTSSTTTFTRNSPTAAAVAANCGTYVASPEYARVFSAVHSPYYTTSSLPDCDAQLMVDVTPSTVHRAHVLIHEMYRSMHAGRDMEDLTEGGVPRPSEVAARVVHIPASAVLGSTVNDERRTPPRGPATDDVAPLDHSSFEALITKAAAASGVGFPLAHHEAVTELALNQSAPEVLRQLALMRPGMLVATPRSLAEPLHDFYVPHLMVAIPQLSVSRYMDVKLFHKKMGVSYPRFQRGALPAGSGASAYLSLLLPKTYFLQEARLKAFASTARRVEAQERLYSLLEEVDESARTQVLVSLFVMTAVAVMMVGGASVLVMTRTLAIVDVFALIASASSLTEQTDWVAAASLLPPPVDALISNPDVPLPSAPAARYAKAPPEVHAVAESLSAAVSTVAAYSVFMPDYLKAHQRLDCRRAGMNSSSSALVSSSQGGSPTDRHSPVLAVQDASGSEGGVSLERRAAFDAVENSSGGFLKINESSSFTLSATSSAFLPGIGRRSGSLGGDAAKELRGRRPSWRPSRTSSSVHPEASYGLLQPGLSGRAPRPLLSHAARGMGGVRVCGMIAILVGPLLANDAPSAPKELPLSSQDGTHLFVGPARLESPTTLPCTTEGGAGLSPTGPRVVARPSAVATIDGPVALSLDPRRRRARCGSLAGYTSRLQALVAAVVTTVAGRGMVRFDVSGPEPVVVVSVNAVGKQPVPTALRVALDLHAKLGASHAVGLALAKAVVGLVGTQSVSHAVIGPGVTRAIAAAFVARAAAAGGAVVDAETMGSFCDPTGLLWKGYLAAPVASVEGLGSHYGLLMSDSSAVKQPVGVGGGPFGDGKTPRLSGADFETSVDASLQDSFPTDAAAETARELKPPPTGLVPLVPSGTLSDDVPVVTAEHTPDPLAASVAALWEAVHSPVRHADNTLAAVSSLVAALTERSCRGSEKGTVTVPLAERAIRACTLDRYRFNFTWISMHDPSAPVVGRVSGGRYTSMRQDSGSTMTTRSQVTAGDDGTNGSVFVETTLVAQLSLHDESGRLAAVVPPSSVAQSGDGTVSSSVAIPPRRGKGKSEGSETSVVAQMRSAALASFSSQRQSPTPPAVMGTWVSGMGSHTSVRGSQSGTLAASGHSPVLPRASPASASSSVVKSAVVTALPRASPPASLVPSPVLAQQPLFVDPDPEQPGLRASMHSLASLETDSGACPDVG